MSGVKSVTVDFGADQERFFLRVDTYISQDLFIMNSSCEILGPEAQTVMSLA